MSDIKPNEKEKWVERYAAIALSLYPTIDIRMRYKKGLVTLWETTMYADIKIDRSGHLEYDFGDTSYDHPKLGYRDAKEYFSPILLQIKAQYSNPKLDLSDEIEHLHSLFGEFQDFPPRSTRMKQVIGYIIALLFVLWLQWVLFA